MSTTVLYHNAALAQANFRIFDGRYRLLGVIGQSKTSVVYKAQVIDPELGKAHTRAPALALKVFTPNGKNSEQNLSCFFREASALIASRSPRVVQLLDVIRVGELCYLVLELVPGGNLASAMRKQNGPLKAELLTLITLELLQALETIHHAGVLHRDVKPENILLTETGDIKLADFSIARLPSHNERDEENALGIGTLEYLAPECLEGHPSSVGSDLYAVGITMLELLTGENPFKQLSVSEVITRKSKGDIPGLHSDKSLPQELINLIRQATEPNPARRIKTATSFKNQLLKFAKRQNSESYDRVITHVLRTTDKPSPAKQNKQKISFSKPELGRTNKFAYRAIPALAILLIVLALAHSPLEKLWGPTPIKASGLLKVNMTTPFKFTNFGSNRIVLRDYRGIPETILTIREISNSDRLIVALNKRNAAPQLVDKSAISEATFLELSDPLYPLKLDVDGVDAATGNAVAGTYVDQKTGKVGAWYLASEIGNPQGSISSAPPSRQR